jgi:tRNA (guanine-N7-)-methyltransferase
MAVQPPRSVVSYVHRGGRMTSGQQRAWQQHWDQWGCSVSELPGGPIDLASWFGRSAPVMLEIGCGMGETTAALAAAEPGWNYLAVDVYEPGLAQLVMRAENTGLANLRLVHGDAVVLLERHIPAAALAGVRVFFPDPWPKKKHHKRRLVNPAFTALLASRMRVGARLHLATDWPDYACQMLEVCRGEPELCNEFAGWAPRPPWRGRTKFEERAQAEGREVSELMFRRVAPSGPARRR